MDQRKLPRNLFIIALLWAVIALGGMRLYFGPGELHGAKATQSAVIGIGSGIIFWALIIPAIIISLNRMLANRESRTNKALGSLSQPKTLARVALKISAVYYVLAIGFSFYANGFSRMFSVWGLENAWLPHLIPPAVVMLFIVVPFTIQLFIMGRVNRYWIMMLVWGAVTLVLNAVTFFRPLPFETAATSPEFAPPVWANLGFSFLINGLFIWLAIKQLLGKSRAMEGYVYERDERERQLTGQAARNAIIVGFVAYMILVSIVGSFTQATFTATQSMQLLHAMFALMIMAFAGSLLKYKVR